MSFLFGDKQSGGGGNTASAPAVRRMTDPDGASSRRAERLERSRIAQRSGRASTNLTQRSRGQSGTGNYQNSALGSV